MTLVSDIRKTVTDTTPVYAAVGVTDLAVEKVRDARDRAKAARADLDVSALQNKAIKRAEHVAEQAQHMPALALSQSLEAATKAQKTYAELAVRGHKLVKRLRTQKSTQDLIAQADSTLSLGKGAVTTVRKAAVDMERAAMATLTTGRHEAEVVIEAVQKEAKAATDTVRKAASSTMHMAATSTGTATETVRHSAAATSTSVKRTATTAKKSTTAAQRATKSAATGAAKTAAAAVEATKVATPKIGD